MNPPRHGGGGQVFILNFGNSYCQNVQSGRVARAVDSREDPKYIAIIFPVDRILDMCRTVINVTGDATVSSIVAASQE